MTQKQLTFLLKTLFISYLFTLIALLAAAFAMYRLHLRASQMETIIVLLYLASCFLGGFLTGKSMKTRRVLCGLGFGLLYFLVLLGISGILRHSLYSQFSDVVRVLGFCAAGGALGGISS